MGPIWAIAKKDWKLLARDRSAFFWVLGMPILLAMFFGAIFGNDGPRAAIKLAVVDLDRSPRSAGFVRALAGNEGIELKALSLEAARESVRKGERVAYLVLPRGLGERSLFAPEAEDPMELGIDPKRKAEAGLLDGLIQKAWFEQLQAALADPKAMEEETARSRSQLEGASDLDPAQRKALLDLMNSLESVSASRGGGVAEGGMQGPKVVKTAVTDGRVQPASSFEVTFPQGILWGLIGICTAFSQSMVRERTMGTLQRLRVAPVSRGQLLAGKGLACLLTIAIVSVLLLSLGAAMGVRVLAHVPALSLAILCSGLAFVGLMMLLSVLGKTEQAVAGAGWAVMLVFSMIGGGMVPLMAMPRWMLAIGAASPVRWAITAFEGAIWRGYTLAEMMVPCGILLAFGALFYALGLAVLAKVDSR